jgi:phosphoglycerate dehydrogenase-like enzyme
MNRRVYIPRAGPWYNLFMSQENINALESFAEVVSEGSREIPLDYEDLTRRLRGCSVILSLNGYAASEITAEILRRVGTVRLIALAHYWGQFQFLEPDLAIQVVETSNAGTVAVAEWCLAAALMGIRKLQVFDQSLKNGTGWGEPRRSVGLLRDKTVGLIGLGRTGTYLARLFRSLGVHVIAYSESCPSWKADELQVGLTGLPTLLSTADIISLHRTPLSNSKKLLEARDLSLIKPGCVLINSARAALYDEAALVKELCTGRFSAYIDVYAIEPLPLNHVFRRLSNVTITPHIAGNNAAMFLRCARESVAWLKDFFDGKEVADKRYAFP